MQSLYEGYPMGHMQCGRHICSEAYASNVGCMHAMGHGHIVDCIEFVWGRHPDIVDLYLHMK